MTNIKTLIEEWSVKDLEDGSSLSISVIGCTELGNEAKPAYSFVTWVTPLITNR